MRFEQVMSPILRLRVNGITYVLFWICFQEKLKVWKYQKEILYG